MLEKQKGTGIDKQAILFFITFDWFGARFLLGLRHVIFAGRHYFTRLVEFNLDFRIS